jgi:hypothetical protein
VGISGHILGDRKLRQVNRNTGMHFDRAYNRNGIGVGRLQEDGQCVHYFIDFHTWEVEKILEPTHWTSCPR